MLKTIKHRQGLKSRSTIMIHDCVCIDVMNVLNIGKCRIYRALGSISLIKCYILGMHRLMKSISGANSMHCSTLLYYHNRSKIFSNDFRYIVSWPV